MAFKLPDDFPERIKRLRLRLNLSQAQLAARLGVSFASVNRWEHGHVRPSELAWQSIVRAETEGVGALAPIGEGRASHTASAPLPSYVSPLTAPQLTGHPAFVGRAMEMRLLRAALDDAVRGRGGVALLIGEPGIGKTRMAEELSVYARQQGAWVLWGRCYEGDGAPAFWPWVQIIRSYIRAHNPDRLRAEMGAGAADIAGMVPEVREHLPDVPLAPPIGDEQARFRLFDSMTGVLTRASQAQPLVVVLDDLHWADTPSLLLLQFLAPEIRGSRILVVGAYRDVEIGRTHPLVKTVAELARIRVGAQIPLAGLSADEAARFIALTTGQQPPASLLGAVMRETAGNPFFIAELVQLLTQWGSPALLREDLASIYAIPASVRGAIGQRLDRLSMACRRALAAGAVVGREFSLTRLLRLGDFARDTLLAALDEAVAARLITEAQGSMGSYRFVHALVRETLYEEMPTAERVRLHQQVGAMLEELYEVDLEAHLAELSYHFAQAASGGSAHLAITYAVRAAEQSTQMLAYEEAARHYERALGLLNLREREEPAERRELLLALGQAQARSGETLQARSTFEQAATLARRTGHAQHLARAALGFAGTVVTPGIVNERVIDILTEALAALGETDSALRARVLGRLAMEYLYSPFRERRDALSREAVAIGRRLDDYATLAFTLNARHYAILGPDTLEQRLAVAIEIGRLAEETGDRELTLQGMPWRIADLLDLGHVRAADEAIATAARLAEELRQPLYLWYAAMFQALRVLMEGRFAEGERLAQAAHAIGERVHPRVSSIYFAAQLFVLRREQGRLAELEPIFKDILEWYPGMPIFRCMLALSYLQSDRAADARAELEWLCADRAAALPWDQLWLGSMAILAEVSVLLGDHPHASMLYDLLLPYTRRNVMVGVPICFGSASAYLGSLAAALGRWDTAARHFEDALALDSKIGAKPFLARAKYAYGAMLLQRGRATDRERASELLAQAHAAAEEFGMIHLSGQILSLRAAVPEPPATRANPSGLTDRELEVLRLIAAGKSTKEIALALVVSVPTVERHITNLYGKIGARSRADATVYALRHHLT